MEFFIGGRVQRLPLIFFYLASAPPWCLMSHYFRDCPLFSEQILGGANHRSKNHPTQTPDWSISCMVNQCNHAIIYLFLNLSLFSSADGQEILFGLNLASFISLYNSLFFLQQYQRPLLFLVPIYVKVFFKKNSFKTLVISILYVDPKAAI